MSKQLLSEVSRKIPAALSRLPELAFNLWFSWNCEAQRLFQAIDPVKWDMIHHNPVRMLTDTDEGTFVKLSADEAFVRQYAETVRLWDEYKSNPSWYAGQAPQTAHIHIAYFSAEFGFHESLPIYSGGLGILAGDHCKSASDLGLPFTGIGLLYRKGYFTQKIDSEGNQQAEPIPYDFSRLPIMPAVDEKSGEDIYIDVPFPDRNVKLKVWQAQVGRISVYLLDADLETNSPWDRELTAQLYGGNQDTRIAQEILLGVGGIKALRALQIPVGVYHINEGHAAFIALERMREQLHKGVPFHVALEIVRVSTVFTTHTPVPAGHDAFPLPMFEHYFGPLFAEFPNHRQSFIQLGLDKSRHLFNMTHLALHTSSLRNGVSKLHGSVSRDMFRTLHGNIEPREVPIRHVTNGVHLDTWLAGEMRELFDRFLPAAWRQFPGNRSMWQAIDMIPEQSLWKTHLMLKEKLIRYARGNLREQRRRNGESADRLEDVRTYLNPNALTIAFARRFATYKRATLLFRDLNRLSRIVNDPDRPVQFIFAGKSHPADLPGQNLIREIYKVSQMAPFLGKIVLLENYDMNMARHLVQGVDIWLNNPLRPYEASGTSGQKAAMNGAINFSVLDGWWEEGYDGTNGWSIDANNDANPRVQERENAESLYSKLEKEIVPLYYNQGEFPAQWATRMKRSIRTLAPEYNTHRMVEQYASEFYMPAIARTMKFIANGNETATKVADYKAFIRANWPAVRIAQVNDQADAYAGRTPSLKPVTVTVELGPVWYKDVAVEIVYYENNDGSWNPVIVGLQPVEPVSSRTVQFAGDIPSHLKHGPHFSVRVYPVSANFASVFELPLVTRK